MKKLIIGLLLGLFYVPFCYANYSVTIGDIGEAMNCENKSGIDLLVCNEVARQIKKTLEGKDFEIFNGDMVFKQTDLTKTTINSECSNRINQEQEYIKITALENSSINFFESLENANTNILEQFSEMPGIAVGIEVSSHVYFRADFHAEYGPRNLFGNCVEWSSEDFYTDAYATVDATSYMVLLFHPERVTPSSPGNIAIKISPEIRVVASFENADFSEIQLHDYAPDYGALLIMFIDAGIDFFAMPFNIAYNTIAGLDDPIGAAGITFIDSPVFIAAPFAFDLYNMFFLPDELTKTEYDAKNNFLLRSSEKENELQTELEEFIGGESITIQINPGQELAKIMTPITSMLLF